MAEGRGEAVSASGEMRIAGRHVYIGDRHTGWLDMDEEGKIWYISPRSRAQHFFMKYQGWGVAASILDFLSNGNTYGIKLVVDTKRVIWASVEIFKAKGVHISYAGYEKQVVLHERHWNDVQLPIAGHCYSD